jgi:hypothetical protein
MPPYTPVEGERDHERDTSVDQRTGEKLSSARASCRAAVRKAYRPVMRSRRAAGLKKSRHSTPARAGSRRIGRTKSVNTEKWNKTMTKLAMPKATWDGVRGRMMKVLMEEHDTILTSCWAQKLGTKAVGMR